MSNLSKKERAALAMHELMKREQQAYADRIAEQRRIALMSDDSLRQLVEGNDLAKNSLKANSAAVKSAQLTEATQERKDISDE